MSISDLIVVMKDGVVQQTGKPQEVYDNPANLFVAKFLGNPQINVFHGEIKGGRLYIGGDAVLDIEDGLDDKEVYVGIRPEGFVLKADGPLFCDLRGVEVMGRDISVVSANKASLASTVRSIISTENVSEIGGTTVRFAIRPHKVFLFDKETEERIFFETGAAKSETGAAKREMKTAECEIGAVKRETKTAECEMGEAAK